MAWMQERQRADGGISVRVEWRVGGGREGLRQEETFSAGSDAQNRARADGFKQMVDAGGQHWPDGWVKGEGFVRVRAEVRHLAPPSFAAVGEEYVRQIVDLSPGQRKRYLAQIRLLAGIEVRGVRIFSRKVDAIAERDIKAWLIDWDRSLKTKANYHGLALGARSLIGQVQDDASGLQVAAGLIGPLTAGLLLLAMGVINMASLTRMLRLFRAMRGTTRTTTSSSASSIGVA